MTSRAPKTFPRRSLSDGVADDAYTASSDHARLVDAAAALAAAELLNQRNAQANSSIIDSEGLVGQSTTSSTTTTTTTIQPQFRTTAPSPSPQPPSTTAALATADLVSFTSSSSRRLRSDNSSSSTKRAPTLSLDLGSSVSSLRPIARTPSFKTAASAASSNWPSPIITAMGDVTPLPSPLLSSDSPGPWKRLARPPSQEARSLPIATSDGESAVNQTKRKSYATLTQPEGANSVQGENGQAHDRNRSISEYIPDPMLLPKRMVSVSGSHAKTGPTKGHGGVPESFDNSALRREPHLAEARELGPAEKPPTPPPSDSPGSAVGSAASSAAAAAAAAAASGTRHEYFEAYGRHDQKKRRWRAVKLLGQGTFSRVMLATSQAAATTAGSAEGLLTPELRPQFERRSLVAVKVCEHGPRGGASEDRVEMSLKRELEIMKSIHHPSLVHLKAWNIEPTRAILVLSYCPGGDLFDVASAHREALTPALLRRMFAEMVGAVRYLHDMRIVHRDMKLENVLVNLPPGELMSSTMDWATYPYSVITVTDLGLSRRIADDEKLETRCGSDDYAAPEVIMGQPYDGRATDAWSLGVLLYALLEGRLPFDPLPGGDPAAQMRMRSRTSHRIARVEWRWVEYGVRDHDPTAEAEGDHEADPRRFEQKGLRGAIDVVEGLLKRARSRWPLAKVAETEWVRGGIRVDGGALKFRDEHDGEEVTGPDVV